MEKRVAIVGGGVIGAGWAARFLLNGWDVRVFDLDPEADRKLAAVLANARRALPGLTDVRLPEEGTLARCASIAEAVADAPWVVEAVPERLEVKHAVYAEIAAVNADGIIASSTSGIMPTDLQAQMARPGRLIVAHPFNPVYLLPLVELVAGQQTDPSVMARAKDIYTGIGMHPLHCRVEIEGFLSDRLQEALWREALWLLHDEVATAEELDAAIAYGPGLRWAQMGTMQTFHLAGGEGGMRAMLAMFGPCLKWPWTKLMEVPELTQAFVDLVGDQCEAQAGALTPRDLEWVRDDNLVGILRSLKARDWGAGAVLNAHDALLQGVSGGAVRRTVPLDWVDDTGHMKDARYVDVFVQATDLLLDAIGCNARYVEAHGRYLSVETRIRYLRPVRAGDEIAVRTQVQECAGEGLHLWHEMLRDAEVMATGAHVLRHVDAVTGAPSMPGRDVARRLAQLVRHARV